MRLSLLFDGDINLPCSVAEIPARLSALQPVQERQRIRRLWQADRDAMLTRKRKLRTVKDWLDRYGRKTA